MLLMTEELRRKLPPLYSTEHSPEVVALAKFFTPWSDWTWYAVEFDGMDTFFGFVEGFEREWGYFSLSELESTRGPGGFSIQRDYFFEPMVLSKRSGVPGGETPVHPLTSTGGSCDE